MVVYVGKGNSTYYRKEPMEKEAR